MDSDAPLRKPIAAAIPTLRPPAVLLPVISSKAVRSTVAGLTSRREFSINATPSTGLVPVSFMERVALTWLVRTNVPTTLAEPAVPCACPVISTSPARIVLPETPTPSTAKGLPDTALPDNWTRPPPAFNCAPDSNTPVT